MENLENLNGLIFELSEKIPNGDYLNLMNYTKKIYDAMKKNELITCNKNTNTHIIKQIVKYNYNDYLLIRDTNDYNEAELKEGDCLRIVSNGTNKKYMKIKKINRNSFIYDLYLCCNGLFYINKNIKLVFSKGQYHENFLDKKIYFHKSTNEHANNEFNLIFNNRHFHESNINIYNEKIY
jgi:hypothetical protein